MKQLLLILLLASMALFSLPAYAKTVYVTDRLETHLRSGPSNQHRITRTIRSGDPLTVIEALPEGYTRVQTPSGSTGWILTRYLMNEPHPRRQLEKLSDIQGTLQTLQTELSEANETIEQLNEENRRLTVELEQITQTAANAIAISRQNEELQTHRLNLEKEVQTLQQIKSDLERSHNHRWFYAGSGVLLLGLVLGLIIPRIRFHQRSNWNSL